MQFSAGLIAVASLIASGVLAAPWPESSKHATHRVRSLPNGRKVVAYQAQSQFETFGEGIDHNLEARDKGDWKSVALSYIDSRLGAGQSTLRSSSPSDTSKNVYVQQVVKGIPVANAVANVAVNNAGKVTAFGNSFVKATTVAASTPTISKEDAISKAESALNGKYNNIDTKVEYVHTDSGNLVLAYTVQVEANDNGHLLESFVDAHSGDVVMVHDFTTAFTYRVLQIQKQDPSQGFDVLTDPYDRTASPNGWHTIPGGSQTNDTSGNNVIAYKGSTSSTSKTNAANSFQYVQNPNADPTVSPNVDAARVNAFYVANTVHDITYRYGFTESSFNFQQNNNGKGGAGNDRVTLSVQDSAGTNNADFSTPPDGQSGHMRMFLWTYTSPRHDGALENDIVCHEATHGTSNRLTGGGTGRCLQSLEAGGMGEGWSDAFADWVETPGTPLRDFTMGTYVYTRNIRTHPYSTSATTNPLRYSSVAQLNEVHNIGEVWANILHNVHAALLNQYGYASDAKTNPDGSGGNTKFMHLFIDQLKLQPCNPTMPTARDAWIQADANRYGGANKCLLWRAFASRGLGVGAANYKDSSSVPSGC